MKKRVIVWKESVYKNGFTCKCGNRFLDEKNDFSADKIQIENSSFRQWVYCKKCFTPVAYVKVMEVPEDAHGLMGNISEYERRKMN